MKEKESTASSTHPLKIQVATHDRWETKQPRIGADVVVPTPVRLLVCGPSESRKSTLLVDMVTRIYAGWWERIYVFSPSMHLDSIWQVAKDHVYKVMGCQRRSSVSLTRAAKTSWGKS